jgi:hypothetical protein
MNFEAELTTIHMFGSLLIATETQGPSYKLLTIIAATFLSAFAFRGKIFKKTKCLELFW